VKRRRRGVKEVGGGIRLTQTRSRRKRSERRRRRRVGQRERESWKRRIGQGEGRKGRRRRVIKLIKNAKRGIWMGLCIRMGIIVLIGMYIGMWIGMIIGMLIAMLNMKKKCRLPFDNALKFNFLEKNSCENFGEWDGHLWGDQKNLPLKHWTRLIAVTSEPGRTTIVHF
jgi:hypothetical protein